MGKILILILSLCFKEITVDAEINKSIKYKMTFRVIYNVATNPAHIQHVIKNAERPSSGFTMATPQLPHFFVTKIVHVGFTPKYENYSEP